MHSKLLTSIQIPLFRVDFGSLCQPVFNVSKMNGGGGMTIRRERIETINQRKALRRASKLREQFVRALQRSPAMHTKSYTRPFVQKVDANLHVGSNVVMTSANAKMVCCETHIHIVSNPCRSLCDLNMIRLSMDSPYNAHDSKTLIPFVL